MVEAGRSQSRGKNRPIDPSFDNSPYLSSPIRPIASSTTTSGKKNRAQSSNNKTQTQCQDDGIAPLRDITVSSKSPTSLLRSTSRSHSAGRQRRLSHDADDTDAHDAHDTDADDGCSLANSTICTARTVSKGNAPRKSPYLMGSTGTKRVGRGATTTTTSKVSAAAKKKPPPKLLLMPDEVDEMLLVFKQQQHEEGKLLLNNNTGDDDGGNDGDDADEEYSSDEEDDSSSA